MKMSFENLYMSQSMHDIFNKQVVPSAEEIIALNLFGSSAKPEAFTLEAMIAAADSYSVSASDLGQYAQH
jgi:hypothetical protein